MVASASSVLIIESDYYEDITGELVRGASEELRRRGLTFERIAVPGALEIPVALSITINNGLFAKNGRYGGCVALGCVIRGETQHNEIVGSESARALLDLAVRHALPLGNGILTVNNRDQAWMRASVDERNKGRDAANACATLMEIAARLNKKANR